jgi:hypothetical protein
MRRAAWLAQAPNPALANENIHIGNLWHGIEIHAALLADIH